MRKPRRVLLLVAILGALAGVGLAILLWSLAPIQKPGITVDNFRRLALGMTEAEVESILGRPGVFEAASPHWKRWIENGILIEVGFGNQDGTLNCASANVPVPGVGRYLLTVEREETMFALLCRWLGI